MPQIDRSPEGRLRTLHKALVARRPAIDEVEAWRDGQHPLAYASPKFKEAFGSLFGEGLADNWCEVVVTAVEERLEVNGFRVGDEPAADPEANAIWQANGLDAQSQLVHTDAVTAGESYVTVWFGDDGPEITAEHPGSTIVAYDPRRPWRRSAALRTYTDEWGFEHAELFLPDAVHRWRNPKPVSELVGNVAWEPDGDPMDNPLGVVPVVVFTNQARSKRPDSITKMSELAPVIPMQRAANKLLTDMLVSSEFHADPQRWATGYRIERTETGEPVPPRIRTDRLLVSEDPAAKFGQLPAADLKNYADAIAVIVQHIASISRTPPHYLLASADRLSGESIKAAETGLVAKVHRKQRRFGEAWEDVIRLAGAVAGNPALAAAHQAEVIWGDAETRTEAEHVDAVMKKQALGVPKQQLWEDLGYTPQQIARFEAMLAEDSLFAPVTDDAAA